MADTKKNPLGPTGEQVRVNVERIRKARGLTYQALSDELARRKRPIPPLGLSRIERGERRVDADDLAALAAALRVSPLALLLPWTERPDAPVEIAGVGAVTADRAWQWADGRMPLTVSDNDPQGDVQRYHLDSRPAWSRDFEVTW